MTKKEFADMQQKAAAFLLDKAHIIIKEEEAKTIEVIDYGFKNEPYIGLQVFTYVNTEKCCAKEIIMFPHQTCLQHRHPPVNGNAGKEETFRCRYGTVYLYVPGIRTENPKATIPDGHAEYLKEAECEIILNAGDQYTLQPDTWHWFQSGDEGCVVSEFSTQSTDENDILTDPRIIRFPKLED